MPAESARNTPNRAAGMDIPDAHCHLGDLDDPAPAIAEAADAGVGPILGVSMSPRDARALITRRDASAGRVLAGAGIHPSRVPQLDDAALRAEIEQIEALAPECDF